MLALDHLVVAARTLEDGVAWCEATLGITPGPGGRHPLLGTHNRLFAIGNTLCPRAYLEIIAIDPRAQPPMRSRWFDLDNAAVREAIVHEPRLVHWVAACTGIDSQVQRLRRLGADPGVVLAAERETPAGMLRWRISVRDDGARLFDGALPTLIEWGERHPSEAMAASGVRLVSLCVAGLPGAVAAACAAPGIEFADRRAPLAATFNTPRGDVTLTSLALGAAHVRP